ncbi:hypothetical protein L596_003214 [Steinernema carpocapsae]|uniref:Uncharacterized protein n=1 Tax=Steinernema carpocapsae TaxID=34508 RepID=A0A4U8URV7_STECR|nr:hypothetical protein L596_003214 [Steinernema carpocapsae]
MTRRGFLRLGGSVLRPFRSGGGAGVQGIVVVFWACCEIASTPPTNNQPGEGKEAERATLLLFLSPPPHTRSLRSFFVDNAPPTAFGLVNIISRFGELEPPHSLLLPSSKLRQHFHNNDSVNFSGGCSSVIGTTCGRCMFPFDRSVHLSKGFSHGSSQRFRGIVVYVLKTSQTAASWSSVMDPFQPLAGLIPDSMGLK